MALLALSVLPAFVTNIVGTKNFPLLSVNNLKASLAFGSKLRPRTMTPSISKNKPKSGSAKHRCKDRKTIIKSKLEIQIKCQAQCQEFNLILGFFYVLFRLLCQVHDNLLVSLGRQLLGSILFPVLFYVLFYELMIHVLDSLSKSVL